METNYKEKFENLQTAVNQFFAVCNPESDLQTLIAENEALKKKLQRRDQEIKKAREWARSERDRAQKYFNEAETLRQQLREIQKGDNMEADRLKAQNEMLWRVVNELQSDWKVAHNLKPATVQGDCKVMSINPPEK